MAPLVTVITSNRHSPDIGDLSEPYGSLDSYQNSGLALTLINIPAWTVVEQIIASTPNVTASITPCKRPVWFSVFLPSSFILPSFLPLSCSRGLLDPLCPLASSPGLPGNHYRPLRRLPLFVFPTSSFLSHRAALCPVEHLLYLRSCEDNPAYLA